MDELYPQAIQIHAAECVEHLDELATIASKRELSNFEYLAAERLLQRLVESGIGVAKHWLKSIDKVAPANAYPCFIKLAQHGLIDQRELDNWKKMIGLRNVLVHDYIVLPTHEISVEDSVERLMRIQEERGAF